MTIIRDLALKMLGDNLIAFRRFRQEPSLCIDIPMEIAEWRV
jgi:hypothetical protein